MDKIKKNMPSLEEPATQQLLRLKRAVHHSNARSSFQKLPRVTIKNKLHTLSLHAPHRSPAGNNITDNLYIYQTHLNGTEIFEL